MAVTYQQVIDAFKAALTEREVGTLVQVDTLEDANLLLAQYVQEQVAAMAGVTPIRQAHGAATAGVNLDLTWDEAFADNYYTFTVTGWDAAGNPVAVKLITQAATKITVKTLVNCSLYAIAKAYGEPS